MTQVVQRRVDILNKEGIDFKCNVEVGSKKMSAKKLLEENDAVVLCLGATWPRDLPIPGKPTFCQIEGGTWLSGQRSALACRWSQVRIPAVAVNQLSVLICC
jgi:hypothetical protein